MTKNEITKEISSKTGLERGIVMPVVESLMDCIKLSLTEKNEPVYLRGFGTFFLKERAEKKARNISQGTTITIPAHRIPAFKPAPVFKEKIK